MIILCLELITELTETQDKIWRVFFDFNYSNKTFGRRSFISIVGLPPLKVFRILLNKNVDLARKECC